MNVKNFSLDWIQPNTGTQPVSSDPWADAVSYYGPPILKMLQEGGRKSVQELFQKIQDELKVPQLQLDQFIGIIDRMILNKQLTVIQPGATQGEAVVALSVT